MAKHCTKKEADAVATFAGEVLAALRMPQWTILVMEDPCDEDALAEINPIEGKHAAQLYLCEGWMKRSEQERMNTIVHEVCHLVHNDVSDHVHDAKDLMHDHEFEAFWARFKRSCEYMVDHLAFFLCETHTIQGAWDKAHGRKA